MKYTIKLHNKTRTFSTFSNLSEEEIGQRKYSKVILLLHGFPDNNTTYDGVWPHLLEAHPNSLLLAPLLRGYEPSSQGKPEDYRISDLADDIRAWIGEVVPPQSKIPVHLVGHDWGAIATFRASADFPELITSASTLAIPYLSNIGPIEFLWKVPEQVYRSSYIFTMQFEFLYKPKFSKFGPNSYLDKLWKWWSPTWSIKNDDIQSVKETFKLPGVIDAITGYYRCMVKLANVLQLKWEVDFDKVPTLILGGIDDGCMSKKIYEIEMEKFKNTPNVSVELLPKVGHFLQREDPEKVALVISDWINLHDPK